MDRHYDMNGSWYTEVRNELIKSGELLDMVAANTIEIDCEPYEMR